jgi:Fur family zinc uptake transcriptional regulator
MKNSAERLDWALNRCAESQLRMTPVRGAVLDFLSEQRKPVSLDEISQAPGVKGQYDSTTVYRTLMVFKDAGLVRNVGIMRRTSHFVMSVPGEVNYFLVCERCGSVVELGLTSGMLANLEHLALENGFATEGQSMDLHGICRNCKSASARRAPASKVMARYCLV